MAGQRLSKLLIRVDGDELETMPGASIDLGGTERKPVTGDNRHLGHTENEKPSMIECEIAVGTQTSLASLWAQKDFVCTCTFDTGQVYVVRNANFSDTPKATGGEGGKVPVKIFGDAAQELTA